MFNLILAVGLSVSLPEQPDSQAVGVVPHTPTSTQTADKVLDRVDAAGQWVSTTLEKVAEKLGTTVEYLWPTYVRRVIIGSLAMILGGVLSLLVGIVLGKVFFARVKYLENLNDGCTDDEETFYTIFGWLFILVGVILGICLVCCGIPDLIAPEPQALRDIAEAVRMLK